MHYGEKLYADNSHSSIYACFEALNFDYDFVITR